MMNSCADKQYNNIIMTPEHLNHFNLKSNNFIIFNKMYLYNFDIKNVLYSPANNNKINQISFNNRSNNIKKKNLDSI